MIYKGVFIPVTDDTKTNNEEVISPHVLDFFSEKLYNVKFTELDNEFKSMDNAYEARLEAKKNVLDMAIKLVASNNSKSNDRWTKFL